MMTITNENFNEVLCEVQEWMALTWNDEELNDFFTSGFGEHKLVNYNSKLGIHIRINYGLWNIDGKKPKSSYPIAVSELMVSKIWELGPRKIYELRK